MPRQRRLLALILLAYLAITLAYGALNPLFEAPDEHWHFFTAESIARTGRLPRVEEPPDEFLGQEAAQPPLYYLLGARPSPWPPWPRRRSSGFGRGA